MDNADYFNKYVDGFESLYQTDFYDCIPFINFAERYNCLYRYWRLSSDYVKEHISKIKTVTVKDHQKNFENALSKFKDSGEDFGDGLTADDIWYDPVAFDIASEDVDTDTLFFNQYVKMSTLSFALSLVEDLIREVCDTVSKDFNIIQKFEEKNIPYINKYINWLIHGCGISIYVDATINRKINTIRELRNSFVHRISKDIPNHIKKELNKMISNITDDKTIITDEIIESSLITLAEFVGEIEKATSDFYDKKRNS